MKKIVPIILIIVALMAGGVFFFLRGGGRETGKAVMTDLLPEGPILFFHAVDIGKNLDDFTATQFWQKLKAIDVAGSMKKMGATDAEIMNYKNFEAQVRAPETQKFFKQFFGQELAVVLYPVAQGSTGLAGLLSLAENVSFITRLQPEAQTVEFFTTLLSPLGKKTSTQSVEYKKHTIHILATEDGNVKIGYVRIKDVLVFGFGDKPARRSLDMLDANQKSLSQDNGYVTTKAKFLPGTEFSTYVDFNAFMALIKDQVIQLVALQQGGNADAARQQIEENFEQMRGFKTIGYSSVFDKITKVKFDVGFDKNALNEDIRPIYDCPPVDNKSIDLVPKDVLAYQWSTCYDLNYYWKQMQKDMQRAAAASPGSPSPSDSIKKLEENLKLSVTDDILPAFGQQLGGYLQDIKIAPEFPIPSILLFIETKSKEKAEKVISALIAQQPSIQLQQETYGDHVIQYVTLPISPDLAPAYAVVGNYLLIATNRQMIKNSIDLAKNPNNSITANPSFKELNFGLTEKNNSILFLQIDALMDRAQSLADWGNKWIAGQYAQQEAFKSGSEKRLADIKAALEKEQAELKDLRDKAKSLGETTKQPTSSTENQPAAGAPEQTQPQPSVNTMAVEALDLVKQIEEKEKSVEANKEALKQLEEIVAAMNQSQPPDPQTRQALVEDLLKPVFRAFASLQVLTSRAIFGEGILEAFSYLKIE